MTKRDIEREAAVAQAAEDYENDGPWRPWRGLDDPELRADLADAAAFLLPIAQAHHRMGRWPIEVAAWLIMVRDSFAARVDREVN